MQYCFGGKDVCNSTIKSSQDDALRFTVATNEVDDKTQTEIWHGDKASRVAVIHWDDRVFEIYGRKLSFTTVKAHSSGFLVSSTDRIWRWDGDAYLLEHDDGEWELKEELSEQPAAKFTSYHPRTFHDDEPASIQIEPHVQRETVFFILLFVYSEFKRQTSEKETKAAVKGIKRAHKLMELQDQ